MTELFVHLDRSDSPVYRPGETITARILVSAPRAIKCKQLTAKLRFFAHGSGNAHQKVVEEKALYAGEFSPGQHEYTVQFVLPYGPYSYAGHYMNLDWEVQAYLDIPWALDKKGATQFSLVSEGASAPQEHLEQLEPRPNIGMHAEGFVVAGIGLMLCLLSIGIILGAGLEGAGCAIINGIIGLLLAGVGLKKFLATRIIKHAQIQLTPWPVRTGRSLAYKIEFVSGADVTINHIILNIRAREVVVRGSGTSSTTYTHDLFDEDVILAEEVQYKRGQKVSLSHVIPLMRDLPPSINLPSNRLTWEITSEIDIPNWPDWKTITALQVLPGYALFSEEDSSGGATRASGWDTIEQGDANKPPGPSW